MQSILFVILLMVKPSTHDLQFHGSVLRRGFWLYVWEISTSNGPTWHYVGRTGDSSSLNAQSPFNRMGQHLGHSTKSNALRRHLNAQGIVLEECRFRLIAHGPILPEAARGDTAIHRQRRDILAAMEKSLRDELCAAGYRVLNTVACRHPLDTESFTSVRKAFVVHFPGLERTRAAAGAPS